MAVPDGKRNVTATIDMDTYERVKYWAARRECSVSEYIALAIDRSIAYENKDYDLPSAEIDRLNQLVDLNTVLSSNIESLETIVINGFGSLLGLTRGDNYLIEDESGDLNG